jgi:hypothetical protein
VLLVVLFFVGPLAILVWWLATTPEVPPLDVVAFDQVAVPGEPIVVRAQLIPDDETSSTPRLSGLTLHFVDPNPGRGDKSINVLSDARGVGHCDWILPGNEAMAEVEVRYIDTGRKQGAQSRARLFVLPRAAKILLVDVETLTDAVVEEFWQREDLGAQPVLAEAAATLRLAADKGWQVIYLATGPAHPFGYRRLRDFWIARRVSDNAESEIPGGPVLARPDYDCEVAAAQRDITAYLRQRFQGPLLAIARRPEASAALRQAGITTFEVNAEAQSWALVRKDLQAP